MLSIGCRFIFRNSANLKIAASGNYTTHVNNGELSKTQISLRDFYKGKSVFLTGGSGFLGKLFIQKLLDIDGIDKIYLLIREKKEIGTEQRIKEIVNNELFSKIRQTRPEDLKKIVPVEGDIALPNLGISDENEKILKEKVSVVIHSGAAVKFHEKLTVAMNTNVEGTKRVLKLCKRIKNLEAFVHISTAFTNIERKVIEEVVYPSPRTIQEVYDFIQKGYTDNELLKFFNSKNNTYIFTKSIAEKYIEDNHGDIPTAIIRPSIVTSTARPPCVGWLDNWAGSSRLAYDIAQGYARVVYGDGTNIIDLFPADYCGNLTIAAAANCALKKKLTVYHACSSGINPITIGEMFKGIRDETFSNRQNDLPFPTILYAKRGIKTLTFLLQTVPAHIADLFLKIRGRHPKWVQLNDRVILYRDTYRYFTTSEWIFVARNVRDLHEQLSPEDQQLFPVSVHDLDWKTYVPTYSQGIRKHLILTKK